MEDVLNSHRTSLNLASRDCFNQIPYPQSTPLALNGQDAENEMVLLPYLWFMTSNAKIFSSLSSFFDDQDPLFIEIAVIYMYRIVQTNETTLSALPTLKQRQFAVDTCKSVIEQITSQIRLFECVIERYKYEPILERQRRNSLLQTFPARFGKYLCDSVQREHAAWQQSVKSLNDLLKTFQHLLKMLEKQKM